MNRCLYDQWFDGESKNISNFVEGLFRLVAFADGTNKERIVKTWPEYFEGSQNI